MILRGYNTYFYVPKGLLMWILSLNKNETQMATAVVEINVDNSGYFYKH